MKKLLSLLCLTLLAACIDVEDFGAYWDKTTLDPALAGHWKKPALVKEDAQHKGQADELRFTEKNGAYEVAAWHKGEKTDDPLYPVKSLDAGPYHFIASGPKNGDIVRYKIEKGVLKIYVPKHQPMLDYIRDNYQEAENIGNDDSEGETVKIKVFDDEVFDILSNVPDSDAYWAYETEYRKVP